MQAGDDVMKQVEDEAMSSVQGLSGMDSNRAAMHEVIAHERDLILARCTILTPSYIVRLCRVPGETGSTCMLHFWCSC